MDKRLSENRESVDFPYDDLKGKDINPFGFWEMDKRSSEDREFVDLPYDDLKGSSTILAELFAGKPIMPGRTEVEQMHKIFKLCGSPMDEYWEKQNHRMRAVSNRNAYTNVEFLIRSKSFLLRRWLCWKYSSLSIRKNVGPLLRHSKFFTSNPLPCDPSSLPNYPPSKELDAKMREAKAKSGIHKLLQNVIGAFSGEMWADVDVLCFRR
ncbi:probable serine/threonine-protein kinase at1g54610 [Phtheirospermum japonicum]|uniref:Probable serine/threonine-protein kinase at1g54610 n=1 Tax=Phtheirospermum japonicum TaxID=374723 RepID=A0A830BWJ6_9LAMI|nr:probable serine/threonine-protein kinase at1g54610 [Phtheirospermum japonicum]